MYSIGFSLLLLFFQETNPPTPTLVSVEPSSVVQGTTVAVTFRGTGFVTRQTGPEIPAADVGAFMGIGVAGATQYTDERVIEQVRSDPRLAE